MSEISNLAAIAPSARIGRDVEIGPFCVVGPEVVIGDGCRLMNNVTIRGRTQLGPQNVCYPNVVIGVAPQDLKYRGTATETIIGARNVFRENVTVHRGTELGGGRTVIGNDNLFMVGVHIAHDCIVGDGTIIGNQTQLAGHVRVEDQAVISALCGLHHFVTVGRLGYVGGLTPVRRDVPPFMKFDGDPNQVRGVNEEGLRRNGFGPEDIAELKKVYRLLYRGDKDIASVLKELQEAPGLNGNVAYLVRFVQASCTGRFGRYQELHRKDTRADRLRHRPVEVQPSPDEEVET